jgi:hypothetical protein
LPNNEDLGSLLLQLAKSPEGISAVNVDTFRNELGKLMSGKVEGWGTVEKGPTGKRRHVAGVDGVDLQFNNLYGASTEEVTDMDLDSEETGQAKLAEIDLDRTKITGYLNRFRTQRESAEAAATAAAAAAQQQLQLPPPSHLPATPT